jgi:hypothetical protein
LAARLPFFVWIATLAAGAAAAPSDSGLHSRTLSVGGVGQEPKFTLDISAADRIGEIVVKNDAGAEVQTLTCDLFRDWGPQIAVTPDMTAGIIDYHGEQFVSSVKAADLDFDGLPDIQAVRDFTAKSYNYCVWLFDSNRHMFMEDALSRQMEDLVNLGVDTEHGQILSYTIGPTFPSRDEHRIDSRTGSWNRERRLLPVRSCVLDTGAAAEADRVATVTRYVDGQSVVQRLTVSHDCEDVCADGCRTVPAKNGERRTP